MPWTLHSSAGMPETRYARSGDVHIAYQVFGEGDLDLVLVNGFVTHVELMWEHEASAGFLEALGSFARVINFDRRGSGLSDPVADAPTLEERMDDVRAVMDAAGSERAALFGISEGVPMSILFAATYPDRVSALVCSGGLARSTQDDDYPFAPPAEALLESGFELVLPHWGEGAMIEVSAPSRADDPGARAFTARMERASASPGMLGSLGQMFIEIDVRNVVPSVQAPTLVLHRRHDRLVNVRHGRWLAEHLPNAARRAARRGPRTLVRRARGDAGRDRGVPHRHARRARPRADPRDRPLHRHRGLHEHGGRAGRPGAGARCSRATGAAASRSRASGAAR